MRNAAWMVLAAMGAGGGVGASMGGCTHKVDVQPIRIEPIYMTLDVRVRIDRELEDAFDFEDRIEQELEEAVEPAPAAPATTPPAATPVLPPRQEQAPASPGGVK